MSRRRRSRGETRLDKICRRFEDWRQTKRGHPRIPESLWRAAVRLAGHYSVHQISRALRVNHTDLSRRVEAAEAAKRSRPIARPMFVEVASAESTGSSECVVEIEDPSGARIRIYLRGTAVSPGLAALSRSFWRGES